MSSSSAFRNILCRFLLVVLAPCILAGCGRDSERDAEPPERHQGYPEGTSIDTPEQADPDDIRRAVPSEVEQFHKLELRLTLPEGIIVDDSFRFDAYDADNDGTYFRAHCIFTHVQSSTRFSVPAFFMKESPEGPWRLTCRFSPSLTGEWSCYSEIHCKTLETQRTDGDVSPVAGSTPIEKHLITFACLPTNETGPMVKSGPGQNPGYLYRLKPDGSREPFWGMSVCRPWVVGNVSEKSFRDEWIDRETELFAPMRDNGCNLLSMWMAPWELLICHKSPAEYWQVTRDGTCINGAFTEHKLPVESKWRPYAYYDQGRAAAMDRILEMAEIHNAKSGPIHILLAFMPHQVLLVKNGQWDVEFTDEELEQYSRESPEKLFGLADFERRMNWLEFFQASPHIENRDDWRRQYWDWQANFARYVIARWGYSRSLGMWVVMDELDGMGTYGALRNREEGWWSTPECDRWHDDFLRMFRGRLEGYDGDPFAHLITSSTMFYNPDTGEEINGTWDGGEEKVDVVTYHSYPVFRVFGEWMTVDGKPQYVQRITNDDPVVYALSNFHSRLIPADSSIWAYAANRIHNWSRSVGEGKPRIVTESGFVERPTGGHSPAIYGKKYPTVYHYQLWAALVSGHAAAPFDWNDGKEFGEMKWRERDGEFRRQKYPIDLYAELVNVQRFLDGEDISRYTPVPDVNITSSDGLTVWCTADSTQRLLGWAFISSDEALPAGELSLTVNGLDPNTDYHTQWYNTWTGEKIGDPIRGATDVNGQLMLVAGEFLARSVIEPERGPNDFENNPDDWHDDGKDAAFKITRRQE